LVCNVTQYGFWLFLFEMSYGGHCFCTFGWCLWLSGGPFLLMWVACLLASTSCVLVWTPFDPSGISRMGPRIAFPALLFYLDLFLTMLVVVSVYHLVRFRLPVACL
jgi:hypothetical protein